ncbi:MAG TPA: hypothetical protein VHE12_10250 [bacterium]|nr:hypothetical protein [bacterium]
METYRPTYRNGQWVVVDSNGDVVALCESQSDSLVQANSLNGY